MALANDFQAEPNEAASVNCVVAPMQRASRMFYWLSNELKDDVRLIDKPLLERGVV